MAELAGADRGALLGWLGLLAVLGLWMLGARNRLTGLRAAILAAWGPVDVALQQRGQALRALLAEATGPLAGEHAALDAVAQAQAQVEAAAEALRRRPVAQPLAAELGKADAVLSAVSLRLLALVEHQAELRGVPAVQAALAQLQEAKPRLVYARQAFNEAGQRYNIALGEFPTRLLVPVFRLEPAGAL